MAFNIQFGRPLYLLSHGINDDDRNLLLFKLLHDKEKKYCLCNLRMQVLMRDAIYLILRRKVKQIPHQITSTPILYIVFAFFF